MKLTSIRAVIVAAFSLLLSPALSQAFIAYMPFPRNDGPINVQMNWPAGVQELANDPLRTRGWNISATYFPGTLYSFELNVRNTEDAVKLIQKLAAIKADNVRLQLDPRRECNGGFLLPDNSKGITTVFTIGSSQAELDKYFQSLPVRDFVPAERAFNAPDAGPPVLVPNARVYRNAAIRTPHRAIPPMLILYIGSGLVDLSKLQIPQNVEVTLPAGPAYIPGLTCQPHEGDQSTVKAIQEFIEDRRIKNHVLPTTQPER